MAADEGSGERTEEPSGKKLAKASEEGRFPQSRDLSFLLLLVIGAVVVLMLGGSIMAATARMMTEALRFNGQEDAYEHLARWAAGPLQDFALWLSVFIGSAFVGGLFGPLVLNKMQFVFSLRGFDLSKLDPIVGFGRMFTLRNFFMLGKGLAVTLIVLIAGIGFFLYQRDSLMLSPSASVTASVARLVTVLGNGWLLLAAVVLLIAIADATFQWVSFHKDMRMTKQEQKDESKESEGSPEIKARLRAMQRAASRRRMMSAVEKADVVVVNPTHYAVALRYDRDRMNAPTVIAKGVDEVALRIRELAGVHGVPLAESPQLARWLTANVELGASIPPTLYAIIAQLLAWAYDSRDGGVSAFSKMPDFDAAVAELS